MAKRKAKRKTPKVANPWHDLTTEEAMQGVTLTDANGRQIYPPLPSLDVNQESEPDGTRP
jgi:hypothetical protein